MKENLKIIFFLYFNLNNGGNFINGLINGNRIFKNNNIEMYNGRFFNGKKTWFWKVF